MTSSSRKRSEGKHDAALKMTFPASDPPAHGSPTGTEAPRHPVDRTAPEIARDEVEDTEPSEGQSGLGGHLPVDHPDRATVNTRQGTGPRATVSVLLISIAAAAVAGAIIIGYFIE